MPDDQTRRARGRDLGTRDAVDRLPPRTLGVREPVVFQIYDGGAMPTATPGQYLGHRVKFTGTPAEGAPVAFAADDGPPHEVVTVWGGTPAAGDLVVANSDAGRWHASEWKHPTAPTPKCKKACVYVQKCYGFAAGVTARLYRNGALLGTAVTDATGKACVPMSGFVDGHYTLDAYHWEADPPAGLPGYLPATGGAFVAYCYSDAPTAGLKFPTAPGWTCFYDNCCENFPRFPAVADNHPTDWPKPWPLHLFVSDGFGTVTVTARPAPLPGLGSNRYYDGVALRPARDAIVCQSPDVYAGCVREDPFADVTVRLSCRCVGETGPPRPSWLVGVALGGCLNLCGGGCTGGGLGSSGLGPPAVDVADACWAYPLENYAVINACPPAGVLMSTTFNLKALYDNNNWAGGNRYLRDYAWYLRGIYGDTLTLSVSS